MKGIIPCVMFMLIFSAAALGVSLTPEEYWGYVYLNGTLALNGTKMQVRSSSGESLASITLPISLSHDGSYRLHLTFDDPVTALDEGANKDEGVVWYVNGIRTKTPNSDTAEPAKINNNFTVEGIYNPQLSYTIRVHDPMVKQYEDVRVVIRLENTGKGTGTVDISGAPVNIEEELSPGQTKNLTLTFGAGKCGSYANKLNLSLANALNDTVSSSDDYLEFEVIGPDLLVQSVTLPNGSFREGQTVDLTAVVSNRGTAAMEEFDVIFYDGEPKNGIQLDSIKNRYHLLPGKSQEYNFSYDTMDRTGNHKIYVVASSGEQECNVKNNVFNSALFSIEEFGNNFVPPLPTGVFTASDDIVPLKVISRSAGIVLTILLILAGAILLLQVFRRFPRKAAPATELPTEPKNTEQDARAQHHLALSLLTDTDSAPSEINQKMKIHMRQMENKFDTHAVLDVLREGNTLLMLNMGRMRAKDYPGFMSSMRKIKITADAQGSRVYGLSDGSLLILPRTAELHKK